MIQAVRIGKTGKHHRALKLKVAAPSTCRSCCRHALPDTGVGETTTTREASCQDKNQVPRVLQQRRGEPSSNGTAEKRHTPATDQFTPKFIQLLQVLAVATRLHLRRLYNIGSSQRACEAARLAERLQTRLQQSLGILGRACSRHLLPDRSSVEDGATPVGRGRVKQRRARRHG